MNTLQKPAEIVGGFLANWGDGDMMMLPLGAPVAVMPGESRQQIPGIPHA